MKLNLLTALTLVVLPAVAMAAPTMQHVATFTPARQVNVGHPYVQYPPIAFKNALQFNEVDGQPVR